ncbi:MAG TPA: polyphosphate kinase 1 [Bacteroidia bacterium]|nr:polyphosphate kinase 1 [Bacteroidia bacterium]HNP97445.1 polyphosphate kinase 1 [Bacteroidia bacterium]
MGRKQVELVDRDLSWLSFNARVLQEAEDISVPLLERLRFLGIFSSNSDEFFRVRVATIRRMSKWGKKGKDLLGTDPEELLEKIQKTVLLHQKKFEKIYAEILLELEKENISIINEKQLTKEQGVFVRNYFHEHVYQFLVPIMIDSSPKFPYLKDKSIYLAIVLSRLDKSKKDKYSLIEIPSDVVSRFLVLPSVNEKRHIILLDDVIRFCLNDIFSIFDYDAIEAYTIKLTRDAELDIDSDVSKSYVEKISKSVKQRKKGDPVRLAYDENIPVDLLAFILRKIKLFNEEHLIPGGRYHNFKDFISFPNVGRKELRYAKIKSIDHPDLKGQRSLFKAIKNTDVLLAYPYHSFHHIIDLLREASIDPKVTSIRLTLYRAANNSSFVNTLINAIKNGKQVTAVVELQARFDEETNIFYANKLQEEGAEVIFGVPGLKVHSKLILISRKEGGKTVNYAHVGTGNFNEQTAKVYSDHALLTSNKQITAEIERLFSFYKDNYKTGHYKHLIVSPFNTRKKFCSMIEEEMENAKAGREAKITLKMNSLVDREMISLLYEASCAGVKIKMIVRGICSLIPGVKGMSENIEVISIVDKFLEHSRIFIFHNGGKEKFYIASGDWMYRNLDHRSEVAVPIVDHRLQEELRQYIAIQFQDNCKARVVNKAQDNHYVVRENGKKVRAQVELFTWLQSKAKKKEGEPAQTAVIVKTQLLASSGNEFVVDPGLLKE